MRRRSSLVQRLGRVLFPGLMLAVAHANAGGPLGIDHRLTLDDNGIWSTGTQRSILAFTAVTVGGTALWEGADSRIGKTAWQAMDASVAGVALSEGLKRVFTRERPTATDDPDRWFKGHNHHSFPSGEATGMAALVTPFVLEYRHDQPAVYALEILPVYTAIA